MTTGRPPKIPKSNVKRQRRPRRQRLRLLPLLKPTTRPRVSESPRNRKNDVAPQRKENQVKKRKTMRPGAHAFANSKRTQILRMLRTCLVISASPTSVPPGNLSPSKTPKTQAI